MRKGGVASELREWVVGVAERKEKERGTLREKGGTGKRMEYDYMNDKIIYNPYFLQILSCYQTGSEKICRLLSYPCLPEESIYKYVYMNVMLCKYCLYLTEESSVSV